MTRQGISYNHDSGKLAELNCPLACVKAWTDEKVVLISNYIQSGGGSGSRILVCIDRSGLLTMALTNILAIRSPFWNPKKQKRAWFAGYWGKSPLPKRMWKRQQTWSPKISGLCLWWQIWLCARLTTTKDNEFVNWDLKNVPHNHAASIIKTEWIKLRNQIKEDTKKEKTRKPMGIINTNNKWG